VLSASSALSVWAHRRRKIPARIFQNSALSSGPKTDPLNILEDKNAPRSDISVLCTIVGDQVHLVFIPRDSKAKETSITTSTEQAQHQKMLLVCEHKGFIYFMG